MNHGFNWPSRCSAFRPRRETIPLPAKVPCEWSLTTLVYNLKRVLNLVSFQKLMAAAVPALEKSGRFQPIIRVVHPATRLLVSVLLLEIPLTGQSFTLPSLIPCRSK